MMLREFIDSRPEVQSVTKEIAQPEDDAKNKYKSTK